MKVNQNIGKCADFRNLRLEVYFRLPDKHMYDAQVLLGENIIKEGRDFTTVEYAQAWAEQVAREYAHAEKTGSVDWKDLRQDEASIQR